MINPPIALASASPRRLELLQSLDLMVRVVDVSHDEYIHPSWMPDTVPERLACSKNDHAYSNRQSEEILITADTVVLRRGKILNKPRTREDAVAYLQKLSNSHHEVITGVCLTMDRRLSFSVSTKVWMEKMTQQVIDYYIDKYRPYDKAGGYGIQEWIGWSHVARIEGSYSNVIGLPTCEVFKSIRTLCNSGQKY